MSGAPLLVAGVLSPDQAAAVRAEMDAAAYQPAWTVLGETGLATVDPGTRSTRVVAVGPAVRELVADRLVGTRPELERYFGVTLTSMESPEFLLYTMGDKFTLHADAGHDFIGRRVSCSLFIASDSWGEDALRLYDRDPRQGDALYWPLVAEPGLLVAFASDTFHEVIPVAANRYTVVTWFH